MKATVLPFGKMPDGSPVNIYKLENDHGITLEMINYGATIVSLQSPDKRGNVNDVVTGHATWEGWLANEPFFGTTIGRTSNRIGHALFSIDGKEYKVSANHGEHQLHGGFRGFNTKLWNAKLYESDSKISITFSTFSPHMEEGFPGNLHVSAIYTLDNENCISMEFEATTDAPTPVNMTNHAYFNLSGHDKGPIYKHQLEIYAKYITETDDFSIPTGRLLSVAGTAFDFTEVHTMGERINLLGKGYDDNYALNNKSGSCELAAKVFDTHSGRMLKIFTTEPGIQFYTANWFDNIAGKDGHFYNMHEAFALETQHYPDSMNHPEFPDVILRPGQTYQSKTVWKFEVAESINN